MIGNVQEKVEVVGLRSTRHVPALISVDPIRGWVSIAHIVDSHDDCFRILTDCGQIKHSPENRFNLSLSQLSATVNRVELG